MYFVTTKREGYVLFAMTPSERAAVGLTDKQEVHLLTRSDNHNWSVIAKWQATDFSHTDFMSAWRNRDEPAAVQALLDVLPANIELAATSKQ